MRKRPFMLLETMIAFALIVLCVFPLLAPHFAMYRAERQFINKVELDHQVNLLYASVLEKLFLNAINWEELLHNQFPVRLLNYEGSYNFNEVAPTFKPSDVNAPYALFLFTLTFNFPNLAKYRYKVFVVRDRRPENG